MDYSEQFMSHLEEVLAHKLEEGSANPTPPILIIDHDPAALQHLEQMLQRQGHVILKAHNKQEALSLIDAQPFFLIICDEQIFDMNGMEILKEAVNSQPETQRVLLLADQHHLKKAIKAIDDGHLNYFLIKPLEDAQLALVVSFLLKFYRLLKENQQLKNFILTQNQALVKVHKAFCDELEVGGRLQHELLSGNIPKDNPNFDIEALSIRSCRLDGDFFEFYPLATHLLDVVIGDVMGKGLPAALIGTAIKTQLLRFAVPFDAAGLREKKTQKILEPKSLLTPVEILSSIRDVIAEKLIHIEYFATLFYCRFDLQKNTVTYIDCGSSKPIHYQAKTKKSEELKGYNLPIGLLEKEIYYSSEVPLAAGDIFILYSDSVSEAKSPKHELFGTERLIRLIEENAQVSLSDLLIAIKNAVLAFTQKQEVEDDITLIAIKVLKCRQQKSYSIMKKNFQGHINQLKDVRDFVANVCAGVRGNTTKMTDQMQLAINEIFCNIVQHGYRDSISSGNYVRIEGEPTDEGILFTISDQGHSFDPTKIREPNLNGKQERGFGWYIVREIVDEVSYTEKNTKDGWNHLRIFKQFYSQEGPMEIAHEIKKDILIITPKAETLDAKKAPLFKENVVNLISDQNIRHVIFDLHNVKFIDSSGLGTFLSVLRVLNTREGDLKLACMNKPVRAVFELVAMHKIFEIFNSTEDAIRSFDHTIP